MILEKVRQRASEFDFCNSPHWKSADIPLSLPPQEMDGEARDSTPLAAQRRGKVSEISIESGWVDPSRRDRQLNTQAPLSIASKFVQTRLASARPPLYEGKTAMAVALPPAFRLHGRVVLIQRPAAKTEVPAQERLCTKKIS